MHRALDKLSDATFDDPLPAEIRERHKLVNAAEAIRELHFPSPEADLRTLNEFRSPAHWRLIYEEFFWLECGLCLKRAAARRATGISFALTTQIRERIKELEQEIAAIDVERKTQRTRRQGGQGLARVALVGYTNAGKSTLMRALTFPNGLLRLEYQVVHPDANS